MDKLSELCNTDTLNMATLFTVLCGVSSIGLFVVSTVHNTILFVLKEGMHIGECY